MTAPFTVAAVQMVSNHLVQENIAVATDLIAQAAAQGAQLVALPEYFCLMGMRETDKFAIQEQDDPQHHGGLLQQFLSSSARKHGIWLVGGTLPLTPAARGADDQRVTNSTLVYNPQGERVTRYDKIHLFSFSRGTENYDEGRSMIAGGQPSSFEAPCGKVGLTVCYDLRFPELYRALSTPNPCSLILVPSAFTATTGKAHWHVLLRARAIENQCYVLAPAQGGTHSNGRSTYGHSLLIDPWGEIIAELPNGPGVITGTLNPERLEQVRSNLPALKHRKISAC